MTETNPYAAPQSAIKLPMATVVDCSPTYESPWSARSTGACLGFLVSFSLPMWWALLSHPARIPAETALFFLVIGTPLLGTIGATVGYKIGQQVERIEKPLMNSMNQSRDTKEAVDA